MRTPLLGLDGPQRRTLLACASAGILFGYCIAVSNDAIGPIRERFSLSPGLVGVVVSSLFVGALLGCLVAGRACDASEHRLVIGLAGIGAVAGSLLGAAAPSVPMIVLGRLMIGAAVGVTTALTPIYAAETSHPRARGTVITGYQLAIAIGFLLALTVGVGLNGHWRLMFAAIAFPALAQVATIAAAPPSPFSLVARGRIEEARQSLLATRDPDEVDAELRAIVTARQGSAGASIVEEGSSLRRPIMIAVVAALMNALVGAGLVVDYSTSVFAMVGLGGHGGAEIASWTVGLVNALVTVAAIRLINRYGRRPLLSVGLTGIIAALLTAGAALLAPVSEFTGLITLAALLVLMTCYAFSAGPIAWLLVAEVLPARIRSRGGAAATGFNWAANLVVVLLFPILAGNPGVPSRVGVAFFVFALLSIGFLAFVRRYVPETKELSLAELEAQLSCRATA